LTVVNTGLNRAARVLSIFLSIQKLMLLYIKHYHATRV
jgi:hypothetical protein